MNLLLMEHILLQGKEDSLSNMWPIEIVWQNIKFQSSKHVYVFDLLNWHKKLKSSKLQMVLMYQTGFQAKWLGKNLVSQKSRSCLKVCVKKCMKFYK